MNRSLIFLIFCFIVTSLFGRPKETYHDALLILELEGIEEIVSILEDHNCQIIHRYPPDVLIGKFPNDLLSHMTDFRGIKKVITGVADKSQYAFLSETGRYAIDAWNNNFMGMSRDIGLDKQPNPKATPLSNCIILEGPEKVPNLPARSNAPSGADFEDVSEFLLGSISVAVILTESDGSADPSTEDWSAAREAECVSEIQSGFNWLANQNTDANLSFTYHFYYGRTNSDAQTQREPINHSSGYDENWQNEILAKFGYSGNRLTKHYSFLNDLIENDDTNWGAVIWVVDSYNDPDGEFTDGYFAYTGWIGYPYSVMTYDNDGWGISNMDLVTVHEFQHQFYAHDEYLSAGWYTDCSARAGYLNVENQNFQNNCLLNEITCTMRSAGFTLTGSTTCFYTHGHDGWYDDDSDGIPNVLDTNPIVDLDPVPPDPVYTKLLPGNIDINPLPNQNPLGNGNDITLNTIDQFEFKVDNGPWIDGITLNEANDFVIGPFGDGTHTVNVKATNSVGNSDTETFTAEFQTHFTTLSPEALTHSGGRKVWTNPAWDHWSGPGYHVVYEDNGDIYLTTYVRNTVTPPYPYYWTDEFLLSDGNGNSGNPSISAFILGTSDYRCVVWQQYDPSINKYYIKYREITGSSWLPPVTLSTTTTAVEPQPVVGQCVLCSWGGCNYSWQIVWNNGNGLKYASIFSSEIDYIADIEGTNAYCHDPTITDNWYNPNVGIAWENGDIYYQEVYHIPGQEYDPVGAPVNLSCDIAGDATPSITSDDEWENTAMLVWSANYEFEACNDEKRVDLFSNRVGNKIIVARRKDEDGYWGIPRYIQYGSNETNIAPSVGWNESYFHVIWEVEKEDKLAKLDYLEGTGWYEEPEIFEGSGIKTPSISIQGDGETSSAVWAVNSDSPFEIVHQTIAPAEAKLERGLANEVVREGIIHLSDIMPDLKGILIVELERIKDITQNRIVPFAPASREKVTFMGSEHFSPVSNASLFKLKVNLRGLGVEYPAMNNMLNWEIFRAELKRTT